MNLLRRPPPINRNHLSCNITRPLRRQKQHRRSQLPWLTNPSHRHHSSHNCLSSLKNSLGHPCSKHSRCDRIHTNPLLRPLYSERTRKVDNRRFATVVSHRL